MSRQLLLMLVVAGALLVPQPAHAQVSDQKLAERVLTSLREYSALTIFDDVVITVSDRAVTLTGDVTMPYKREEIGARVTKIDGVRSLTNRIAVLPALASDNNLRQRLAQAIYTHPAFWQYAAMACPPIHIIVDYGHVRLTGVVNNELERTLAYALAQIDGVVTVKNELKLDAK
ncbi:MAG TPA: BON domain-containing protein [Vicinamibacterales bacterium]|nr:BON domain-containing protein [Vicinamibacterales bacterium]